MRPQSAPSVGRVRPSNSKKTPSRPFPRPGFTKIVRSSPDLAPPGFATTENGIVQSLSRLRDDAARSQSQQSFFNDRRSIASPHGLVTHCHHLHLISSHLIRHITHTHHTSTLQSLASTTTVNGPAGRRDSPIPGIGRRGFTQSWGLPTYPACPRRRSEYSS
ncbi:hypothetical protein B484DRAFT_136701 [Ochromonadaceae sp. CCMP2298]|nr:hypothetical protein B484DRAFT_136701 [Ochromonadaceae sp. CCMP2298]